MDRPDDKDSELKITDPKVLTAIALDWSRQGLDPQDCLLIMDTTRISFYADKLAGDKADEEKVCENSVVREEITFPKKEILKLMLLFAVSKKLDLDKLKVARVISSKEGVLVVLDVKYPNDDGGYRIINYTIKGRHDLISSRTTNIDETFFDSDDMPELGGSGIVADYLFGKWIFNS